MLRAEGDSHQSMPLCFDTSGIIDTFCDIPSVNEAVLERWFQGMLLSCELAPFLLFYTYMKYYHGSDMSISMTQLNPNNPNIIFFKVF